MNRDGSTTYLEPGERVQQVEAPVDGKCPRCTTSLLSTEAPNKCKYLYCMMCGYQWQIMRPGLHEQSPEAMKADPELKPSQVNVKLGHLKGSIPQSEIDECARLYNLGLTGYQIRDKMKLSSASKVYSRLRRAGITMRSRGGFFDR